MAFTKKMFVAKLKALQVLNNETHLTQMYKRYLSERQEELAELEQYPYENPFVRRAIGATLHQIEDLKYYLRREKRARNQVNLELTRLLLRVGHHHIDLKMNSRLRRDWLYCESVIDAMNKLQVQYYAEEQKRNLKKKAKVDFIKRNKHNYNLLEIEDCSLPESEEYDCNLYLPSTSKQQKRRNSRRFNTPESQCYPPGHVYRETTYPKREVSLLRRLKAAILSLQLSRLKRNASQKIDYIIQQIERLKVSDGQVEEIEMQPIDRAIDVSEFLDDEGNYDPEFSPPTRLQLVESSYSQMETEKAGECDQSMKKTQNVILADHSDPSIADPFTTVTDSWDRLCTSQRYQSYDIMERFQEWRQFEWNKNQQQGNSLLSAAMPLDFVKERSEHASCILLKTFSYFKFESMEICIKVNSSMFHIGQLQASFYYGNDSDSKATDREHVACLSQTTNAIIDASGATEVVLRIPFRYYKPYLATRTIDKDTDILNLGRLRLLVLNQLKTPDGDLSQVIGTVFVRFVKPQLHGMISRELGDFPKAQMLSSVKMVENILHNVLEDPQRDNPVNPTPPQIMAPQNAASWCIADNMPEPANPLRLDGKGTVPYPRGTSPLEDEMKIDYVKRVYGLLSTVRWGVTDQKGKILKIIPFSPSLSDEDCMTKSIENGGAKNCAFRPPVSVLAELFCNWRGSLEYKFDFISSKFHRGRLIIAYVPRIVSNSSISIQQLTACDHIVLDLSEAKSFNVINRFVADKPWWPRRRIGLSSAEVLPPGHIYIAVLNNLTATNTVSQTVEFNIYLRGASDLEFSIPCAPSIALSYNTQIIPSNNNTANYVPSYGPPLEKMYIGVWHVLPDEAAILRYGPGSDHIVQFQEPHYSLIGKVLKLNSLAKDTLPMYMYLAGGVKGYTPKASYMVILPPIYEYNSTKYYYGVPFNTFAAASQYAATIKPDPTHAGFYLHDSNKMAKIYQDGEYSNIDRLVYWALADKVDDEFEIVGQMEREERTSSPCINYSIHPSLVRTGHGAFTYGEKFDDLKVLCRRMQLYSVSNIKNNTADDMLADVSMPILPQGLDLDLSYPYFNQVRDGTIPLILSGYRHGRGSIKFRIEVNDTNKSNFSRQLWVQHQPDTNIRRLLPETSLSSYIARHRLNPGYAYYKQDLNINSIVNLNIPYYNVTPLMLLQRPNLKVLEDAPHYGLGQLNIGITYGAADNQYKALTNIKTFYALGDDFRASTFQGFPATFRKTEFVEAQGLFDPITTWISGKVEDAALNKIEATVTSLNQDVEVQNFIDKVTSEFSSEKKQIITSALSNIIHAVISPNIKTVCWAFLSFFMSLGLIAINTLQSVFANFVKLVKMYYGRVFRNKTDAGTAEVAEAQGSITPEMERNLTEAAFVSTLVTSVLSLLGATQKPLPSSLPSFAAWMREGIPKFTLTANGLYTFFKNNLMMLRKVWYWCISFVAPNMCLNAEIDGCGAEMIGFVKRIEYCLDARNERLIQTDLNAQAMVYELATKAMILQMKIAVSDTKEPKPVFMRLLQKIIDLKDKLAREYKSPPVRYEPFVMGLVGPSKVGKSFMINNLAADLLQAVGYKSYEENIYVRTPGNAYWNNLNAQPIVQYDDFLCLVDPQFGMTQISEIFALKSTAVFNPAKAAIEEKNVRYNPLCVFLCSNESHPVVPGVADHKAFWRRRDMLVWVEKKAEYANVDIRKIPKSVKKNFDHLVFYLYPDSTIKEIDKEHPLTFGEFKAKLIKEFQLYHENECEQYLERLDLMRKNFPKIIDIHKTVDDNMTALEDWVKQQFVPDTAVPKVAYPMAGSDEPMQKLINDYKKQKEQNNIEKPPAAAQPSTSAQAQGGGFTVMEPEFIAYCKCFRRNMNEFAKVGNKLQVVDFGSDREWYVGEHEGCKLFTDEKIAKAFYTYWGSQGRDIEHLPEQLRLASGLHISVSQAAAVEEELKLDKDKHESWWKKTWSRFPSFWGIAKFLAAAGVVLTLVNFVINSVTTLYSNTFGSGAEVRSLENETTATNARTDNLWSDTLHHDAVKANEAMKQYWTTDEASNTFIKHFTGKVSDQMSSSGTSATVGKPRGNPAPIKAFSQSESEIHSVVTRLITRNTFWLRAEYIDSNGQLNSATMRCLGICGRYFLCIDHYWYYISHIFDNHYSNAKLFYISSNSMIEIDYKSIHFDKALNSALYVGQLSIKIPLFRNIVKFFATAKDHQNLDPSGFLVEPLYDSKSNFIIPHTHHFLRITSQDQINVMNDDNSTTFVSRVYVYPKSKKGLCGSVLVSAGNMVRPILGIHIAGSDKSVKGFAECITYESLCHYVSASPSLEIAEMDCTLDITDAKMIPDTNVQILGTVPNRLASNSSGKSRLCHTTCFERFTPSTYDYPVLSSKDSRLEQPFSPLYEGVRNHGFPPKDFPDQEFEIAVKDFENVILTHVKPMRMKIGVLSLSESIVGIEEIPQYAIIDMKTSEGFPLSKSRPPLASNKSWLFDIDYSGFPRLNDINEKLMEIMERKHQLRLNNEVPFTVFTACLKDAKLPKEKVLIPGKTRIFSISPVDFTIQQRQYFMDFSVAHQESRFKTEHAIGIDIKSYEVTTMVNYLNENSLNLVTGDYSKFGDTLMAKCVRSVYKIMCAWYKRNGDDSEENERVRMIFCEEVMHANILCANVIYKCFCGMPSGNPLTVVINSMVNSLYMRVAWLLLSKKFSISNYSMRCFHQNVRILCYGDDIIASVKPEVLEWYNGSTLQTFFAEYDIKFTDSSKSSVAIKSCVWSDPGATFLKHSFYPHPHRFGVWLAKLDDAALQEIPNWTWSMDRDIELASVESCSAFLEEAFGHGPEYHDKYRDQMVRYWQDRGVFFDAPTWFEMDIRIFGVC